VFNHQEQMRTKNQAVT